MRDALEPAHAVGVLEALDHPVAALLLQAALTAVALVGVADGILAHAHVAQVGDAVAVETVRWAGEELGSLVVGVARQLGFERRSFEVVLVGSLYNGGPLLLEPMTATIHAVAPGAHLVRLAAPPAVGATLLGMQAAGLNAQALRPHLIASTRALLDEARVNHRALIDADASALLFAGAAVEGPEA